MVVAIAQLASVLHDDLTFAGAAVFLGLFVPVWLSWLTFAYYGDQFDADDVPFRLLTLLAMSGVGYLAANVTAAAEGDATPFAAAVGGLRLLVAALYLRASRSEPAARTLARRFAAVFAASAALWVVSIVVSADELRYALWAAASALELGGMFLTYWLTRPAPVHGSHMPERFGLFTLVVLGETILVVTLGVTEVRWETSSTLVAMLSFVVTAGLWWLYFDHVDEDAITRGTAAGTLRELWPSFVHGYGHLFVFVSLTAVGVGIELAVVHAAEPGLSAGERAVLGGGVALFLLAMTAIHAAAADALPARGRLARAAGAAACVALVLLGGSMAPLLWTAVLAALVVVVTMHDARTTPSRARAAGPVLG
jgi:low temperature requirement protein LtrA